MRVIAGWRLAVDHILWHVFLILNVTLLLWLCVFEIWMHTFVWSSFEWYEILQYQKCHFTWFIEIRKALGLTAFKNWWWAWGHTKCYDQGPWQEPKWLLKMVAYINLWCGKYIANANLALKKWRALIFFNTRGQNCLWNFCLILICGFVVLWSVLFLSMYRVVQQML